MLYIYFIVEAMNKSRIDSIAYDTTRNQTDPLLNRHIELYVFTNGRQTNISYQRLMKIDFLFYIKMSKRNYIKLAPSMYRRCFDVVTTFMTSNQRCYNVQSTLYQRQNNVCAYWAVDMTKSYDKSLTGWRSCDTFHIVNHRAIDTSSITQTWQDMFDRL